MKTGLRMSAARVKNQTFEDDKGGSKEAYARAQESIAASANINTQDRALSLHDGVARVPELGGCQFTHVGTVLSLAACDLSLPDFQPSILLQHFAACYHVSFGKTHGSLLLQRSFQIWFHRVPLDNF